MLMNSSSDAQLSFVDFRDIPAINLSTPGIIDLPIPGAWLYVPTVHGDERGSFHEGFRAAEFSEKLGYPFNVAQANISRSARNVVRGIHLAEVPPGQAKFVTCLAGEIRDVLVDLRVGSPAYGKQVALPLSEENNIAVYIPIGVGHGFTAVSEQATLNYLVTEAYNPDREFGIDPFDADLAVDWGVSSDAAILSSKDASAPAVAAVQDRLATWADCRGWEKELRNEWAAALADSEAFADGLTDSGERA